MRRLTNCLSVVLLSVFLPASALFAQLGSTVPNWPAASRDAGARGGMKTQGDIANPEPFVPVTPCRVVDTRGPAGAFGGPFLAAGSPRSFSILSGPCTGLPFNITAYSLNITVTNTQGPGFILAYPQGAAQPLVSTLNYSGIGQTVANAAIVPAGSSGGITVAAGVHGTNLIIDINGYYGQTPGDPDNRRLAIDTDGSGFALYVANESGVCTGSCGIFSLTHGINSWAIEGVGTGSGESYGVYSHASSSSPGAARVLGTQGARPGGIYAAAGVRGESSSHFGVLGISQIEGVAGSLVNASSAELAWGALGYNGYGVYAGGNFGGSGAKFFVEPHPTDATKVIRYVALEGPESGTYFRGTAQTIRGRAVIEVPESFRIVTDEEGLTVQLTPVGPLTIMSVESEDLNQIVVRSSKDVTFHYLVHGVRRAFKDFQAIEEGREFMPRSPDDRMPAYLTEEAKRRLTANGTYNADGTVNAETAERAGFTRIWAERERAAKEADIAARAAFHAEAPRP